MSIQRELDQIKNAVYGKEVREAIHDGIKKTYDDASKNGNANMEVEMARGTHSTLSKRLDKNDEGYDNITSQLARTDSSLNNRIDNIIATPTTVSEQEIIDARQGEISLGANIRAIDKKLNSVTDSLTNELRNSDFSLGQSEWDTSKISVSKIEGNEITFTPSTRYQGLTQKINANVGDIIYCSAFIKSSSKGANINISHKAGATTHSLSSSGNSVYEKKSFSITIPLDADLSNINFRITEFNQTLSPIAVKNMIVINLTKKYGAGKEPGFFIFEGMLEDVALGWFNKTANISTLSDVSKMKDTIKQFFKKVTPERTTFLNPTTNLFDKRDVDVGKYVDKRTGELGSSLGNISSGYCSIEPNTNYSLKTDPNTCRYAFYNANKHFISGGDTLPIITSPPEAAFIRFSFTDYQFNVEEMVLNKGNTILDYENYGFKLPDEIAINVPRKEDVYTKKDVDLKISGVSSVGIFYDELKKEFKIYQPTNDNRGHIELIFFKQDTPPFSDGGTYQNYDLWRLGKGTFGEYDGTNFVAQDVFLNGGAWETAISIEGLPDFHGTLHGYEKMDAITFFVDGKEREFQSSFTGKCNQFEIFYNARLIKQGTASETIATISRCYKFEGNSVKLKQRVNWKQSLKIKKAYITMLCSKRFKTIGDQTSKQITDSIITDYDFKKYDISNDSHSTAISYGVPGVLNAKIWGKDSGYCADVSVEYGDKNEVNVFNVSDAKEYNKLYFSYADAKTTSVGDVWNVETKYKFSS